MTEALTCFSCVFFYWCVFLVQNHSWNSSVSVFLSCCLLLDVGKLLKDISCDRNVSSQLRKLK